MGKSDQLRERAEMSQLATYSRFGPVLVEGSGCLLWDADGREYLDFVAGIAVCSLGHANPKLIAALTQQAGRLWHVSNLYYTVPQVELAEALTSRCFAERVFFCNSGAEANEAAIKLARRYSLGKHDNPERFHIVCMEDGFHGRTLATVSATGQQKVRQGFGPLLAGFSFVPFGDLAALRRAITAEKTCAVMLEPILGNGGVLLPPDGYLAAVRELCREHGLLLIFDEVQVGMGRAGGLFCHQAYGVEPDVMTLAKALGGGLPIGAMLCTNEAAKGLPAGSHASTFGGTPLVCAVARQAVEMIAEPEMLAHVRQMGTYLLGKLEELRASHPEQVAAVRGRGLICGLELAGPNARRLMELALGEGLLIDVATERVVRLVPPLIIGREEIDALFEGLDRALPRL